MILGYDRYFEGYFLNTLPISVTRLFKIMSGAVAKTVRLE